LVSSFGGDRAYPNWQGLSTAYFTAAHLAPQVGHSQIITDAHSLSRLIFSGGTFSPHRHSKLRRATMPNDKMRRVSRLPILLIALTPRNLKQLFRNRVRCNGAAMIASQLCGVFYNKV